MVTDTSPTSQALWLRLQRERTPGQQFARALEMTALVRSMFAANLRLENPSINEAEIKRRMVETYYGADWARRCYGPK